MITDLAGSAFIPRGGMGGGQVECSQGGAEEGGEWEKWNRDVTYFGDSK